MAGEWGCPPWQIEGRDSAYLRYRWRLRWQFWKTQLMQKQEREIERAQAR